MTTPGDTFKDCIWSESKSETIKKLALRLSEQINRLGAEQKQVLVLTLVLPRIYREERGN